MSVLIAGATTYIGNKLIPFLLEKGHRVVCLVRDKNHFIAHSPFASEVTIVTGDLLRPQSMETLPADIDAAFYLVSAMTQTSGFAGLEALAAEHFIEALNRVNCKQIITISEIISDYTEQRFSRDHVEDILSSGKAALTVFKTAMVVGEGSIVMELLKGLTERSPVILAGSWARAKTQPIATSDVLQYLESSILNEKTFDKSFEIAGPEVMTFKDMLKTYADACFKDKIRITTMAFMSAKLASHWLNFLTPFNYTQAKNLIDNLKYDNVSNDDSVDDVISINCKSLIETLQVDCAADQK
jgi:uncharacterized protein YbjT (DUF2867 family)